MCRLISPPSASIHVCGGERVVVPALSSSLSLNPRLPGARAVCGALPFSSLREEWAAAARQPVEEGRAAHPPLNWGFTGDQRNAALTLSVLRP